MNQLNILENTEEFKKLLNVQFSASQKSYYDLFNDAILSIDESNKKLVNRKKALEFFNEYLEKAPKVSEKLKANLNALFESLKNNEHVKKFMILPEEDSYGQYYLIVELNDIYHKDRCTTYIFKNVHVVFYLNFKDIKFFTFSKSIQQSLSQFIDNMPNCIKDDYIADRIKSLPIDGFLVEKLGFGGISKYGPSYSCNSIELNRVISNFNKTSENENDIDKSSAVNFVNYILNLILTNPLLFNDCLSAYSSARMATDIFDLDEVLSDFTTNELSTIYKNGYCVNIQEEEEE
jgi:hypothetical protein